MTTLYHPTLPTFVRVPDKDVDSWVQSGWRKTKPEHFKTSAAATAAVNPSN